MSASSIRCTARGRVRSGQLGCMLVGLAALPGCGAPPQPHSVAAIERQLAGIAAQANQAAPANIDPNTRLDGVKAGPGLRLTTQYTLLNAEANGIDAGNFGTKLAPVVIRASCSNPELRPMVDQGVTVVLEYRGTDRGPIGTVQITRATCAAGASTQRASGT